MSIDKIGVSQIIGALVTTLTGSVFIVAEQNSPRPSGAYATVNLFTSNGIGWDEVNHTNQADPLLDLVEEVEGFRQLSFSFNFYRDDAFTNASKFRTLLQSSTSEEYLKENGLGLGLRGATRSIPEEIAKNYEERAQIDIDFFIVDLEALITRSILTAEINGTYESNGEQTNITIDIP